MKYCPDWRLGQLLYNLFTWHFEHYGDPFFPEDAHQPGIAPGKEYRKLIVKAKVNC